MTDSPPDHPLPSPLASIITLENLLQHDCQLLECSASTDLKVSHRVQFAADGSPMASHSQGSGKSYSQLRLNTFLNSNYSLDGFSEPVSPRNTPVSVSRCESPEDSAPPLDAPITRATSAPQIRSLAFEWVDGKSEAHPICFDDVTESGVKIQKRRFPADYDSCSSSEAIPSKEVSFLIESAEQPNISSPPATLNPKPRPTPSFPKGDQSVDYVASHRQQGYFRKRRGSGHALAQRVSPYRNSPKAAKNRTPKLLCVPPISPLSPLRGPPADRGEAASQTGPRYKVIQHNVTEKGDIFAAGITDANSILSPAPSSDLVGVSFSVYRTRRSGQRPSLSLDESAVYVEVTSTRYPPRVTDQGGREAEIAVKPQPQSLEDLILHLYLVLPASAARILLAILSISSRAKNSRIGAILLYLGRILRAMMIAIYLVISAKLNRPATRPPHRRS